MKKRMIPCLLIFILAAAFVLLPKPASVLSLRFTFNEITGDSCSLYYTTDTSPAFSSEQQYLSEIDHEKNQVTFRLDPALEGHITGLRLDFPGEEQLCSISNVTASSAGVIKHRYDPCDFFAEENIVDTHGMSTPSLVAARSVAYFSITPDDPYVVLSEALSRQVTAWYSHYRLTRLAICAFLLACFLIGKKKIFKTEPILP